MKVAFGSLFKSCSQLAMYLGVVGTRVLRDADLGAQHRGADLRDQLFRGTGLFAEPRREITVATALVADPVRLMPTSA